jgi:hypothetical protein
MSDLRDVESQLERALGTLMDAAEQRPDTDLAEAVDHVSAALTRLRATEDAGVAAVTDERTENTVAPRSDPSGPPER